jgi:hypothetical protein
MTKNKLDFFENPDNWLEAHPGLNHSSNLGFMNSRIRWFPDEDRDPYTVNKYAYRSKEFEKNADLLFAGCSITYGEGVAESAIWGNVVASKLNLKAFNLGMPGASVHFIVNNLFNYFQEFGNPKNLFCIFPDFLRMEMYSDYSHMRSDLDITKDKELSGYQNYHLLLFPNNPYAKISKQPHVASEVIPKELALSLSIQHIKYLEMYCAEAGINFLWGTWHEDQENYIIKNNLLSKNFVDLKNNLWHKESKDSKKSLVHKNVEDRYACRKDLKECKNLEACHETEKNIYGKNFDLAFDTDLEDFDSMPGHVGAHTHIHWAEEFIKKIGTLKQEKDMV